MTGRGIEGRGEARERGGERRGMSQRSLPTLHTFQHKPPTLIKRNASSSSLLEAY
jgi:hypothetical protein